MASLFTHEDNYNVHKLVGLYCILNYIYQFWCFFVHDRVYLNVFTIAPHMFLHLTTFIFKVLRKRPVQSVTSMFIWEEMRWHALIFAFRSCFVLLFPDFGIPIVFLTLTAADVATFYHGTPGVSTVRGKQENIARRSPVKNFIGYFFSISQIGATLICGGFLQPKISPILVFSCLPPIQTSAFGMTLLRKNLINKSTWTVLYSIELILTYVAWYKVYGNLDVLVAGTILFAMRKMGMSKYSLWCFATAVHVAYTVVKAK